MTDLQTLAYVHRADAWDAEQERRRSLSIPERLAQSPYADSHCAEEALRLASLREMADDPFATVETLRKYADALRDRGTPGSLLRDLAATPVYVRPHRRRTVGKGAVTR